MEVKLRANIVFSRTYTVEAEDQMAAMKTVREMLEKPFPIREFEMTYFYFDDLDGIRWLDDEKLKKRVEAASSQVNIK